MRSSSMVMPGCIECNTLVSLVSWLYVLLSLIFALIMARFILFTTTVCTVYHAHHIIIIVITISHTLEGRSKSYGFYIKFTLHLDFDLLVLLNIDCTCIF